MSIEWGRYEQAYKAIHDAILSSLAAVPQGKSVTKLAFTYTGGNIETIKYYDGAELLFTLTFSWVNDNLTEVVRS